MSFEQSIIFRCNSEEYAVPVEQVVSIEKIERINPVPHLPKFLLGFTRVRGELIPVLDFSMILYNKYSDNSLSKMIVLQTDVVNYALVVDEAKEILNFKDGELTQMGLVNYAKTKYFAAIANLENRMITCVDPNTLVQSLEGMKDIIDYLTTILKNEEEQNA